MNIRRIQIYRKENLIFYLVGTLAVLGVKYYYSQSGCDSLLWILAPTTHWVELLSGISFTYESGVGYVNHSLRILIAPSCSGVRFMVIAMAMLIFSFVRDVASPRDMQASASARRVGRGLSWIAASIAFSWMITVLVNGLRIVVAIYLPQCLEHAGLMRGMLTPDRLHTMIGVVVYFTALLVLYRLVGYIIQQKMNLTRKPQKDNGDRIIDNSITDGRMIDGSMSSRRQFVRTMAGKCMPPVFWYFLMTLGLPFLNRAYLNGGMEFMEFAVLIICCVILILLPYYALGFLRAKRR